MSLLLALQHLHRSVAGKVYPLEMHIVNWVYNDTLPGCGAGGCATVVGIMFELDEADSAVKNPFIDTVFTAMSSFESVSLAESSAESASACKRDAAAGLETPSPIWIAKSMSLSDSVSLTELSAESHASGNRPDRPFSLQPGVDALEEHGMLAITESTAAGQHFGRRSIHWPPWACWIHLAVCCYSRSACNMLWMSSACCMCR